MAVGRALDEAPPDKWQQKVLNWVPTGGRRRIGRLVQGWKNEVKDFFATEYGDGSLWYLWAQDRDAWKPFETRFLDR